jgi:N-acetyl-1-D-myo-inositol-2-amino-2-deoxy-alpha-D-glucopyranoside deacetylase
VYRSARRRILLGLALLGGLALMVVSLAAWSAFRAPRDDEATGLYVGALGARVLVVAPHPDDEVIAPGGLTATAIASGATVRTVVVTAGDGFKKAARLISGGPLSPEAFRELGALRYPETQASFDSLGVPQADRVYLGYGDAGVMAMWDENWDREVVARNGCTSTPYPFAFTAGAAYRGSSLAADLDRVIADYDPTSVVYPDPDDNHPDHWSTAAFVEYVLESRGYGGGRYTYLAHYGHYPFPWGYLPNAYLRPPVGLVDRVTAWHSLELTDAARQAKALALSRHRSQLRIPHMYVYLRSFLRRNELFGTYTPRRSRASADAHASAPPKPDPDGHDLVVRDPGTGVLSPLVPRTGSIKGLRLVRGPERVWFGMAIEGGPRPGYDCGFHLRLFGDGDPRRLDVTVANTQAKVRSDFSNSVIPASVEVATSGDTLWMGMPASTLDGARSALASGDVGTSGRIRVRSAWRVVRF